MDFHTAVPLVVLLDLVHFRIPLPFSVFGGTERGDQGGLDDRALAHRHDFLIEMGFDSLKDLLAQLVLIQQVTKGEDRGLIRDPDTYQLDASKAANSEHLNQGFLHSRRSANNTAATGGSTPSWPAGKDPF